MDENTQDLAPLPEVTIDGTEEQSETNPVTGAPTGAALYKLLVDGQEEEVDLDELKKRASHSSAAAKRMQEATKQTSDAKRLLEMLKSDPLSVLKELDGTFDQKKFLSTRLAQMMEDELMSPDEKQARIDAQELAELRQSRKKEQEERESKDLEMLANTEREKLDTEFAAAMTKVGLPKTNAARSRLATAMLDALENGKQISTEQLAQQVKQEMQADILELLNVADDDSFQALLGSDLLTKAQKVALRKVKSPGDRQPVRQVSEKDDAPRKGKMSKDEFLASQGLF